MSGNSEKNWKTISLSIRMHLQSKTLTYSIYLNYFLPYIMSFLEYYAPFFKIFYLNKYGTIVMFHLPCILLMAISVKKDSSYIGERDARRQVKSQFTVHLSIKAM